MNRMTHRKETYLHKRGGGHNIEHRFAALGQKYEKPTAEETKLDSTADSEKREKLTFFYHPDHLGSTNFVTDIDGNAVQFVSYIPYGEVFVEERNSSFSSSYLFNAKELDNETGLYYYGARYLDPQSIMWLSVDPLWEKYPGVSPYSYCVGNPVRLVDPDGKKPSAYEAALMAVAVYNDGDAAVYRDKLNESGWKTSNLNDKLKLNYTKFYECGLQSMVFEKTENGTKEFAYVFAGTNSLEDVFQDVAQVIFVSTQYDQALKSAIEVSDATRGHELTFVGHSLGGGEAAAASMALGHDAITFNAAAVSPMSKLRYGLSDDTRITNYVSKGKKGFLFNGGDPLTIFQDAIGLKAPGKRVSISTNSSDWSHTITEFLKHDLQDKE